MADIALRDYDYEIAAMLDAGDFDDAIAHCLHILNIYPKHLQAYRLLAQAFVQSKRGSEAILVFQRLLSAVPDEFDAHRSMSTIYEEKGSIEAALWHAKRAFEIQPAEKAVQDRLRDLFVLRDGKAPPMRLTRGALARMYANQPDQTEQAISEMRSILSEKPERVDLLLLLGRVYHQAGQDDAATQVCITVLEALPHALEANSILAEIYDTAGQIEQAAIHWARVKELEPYDKRLENRMVKAGNLTDDNILIVLEDMPAPVLPPGWDDILGILPSNLVAVFSGPDVHTGAAGETETQTAMDDIASTGDDLLAWLNETPPGPSDTVGTWLDGVESPAAKESEEIPSEPAAAPEIPETSLPLPDWLYTLAKPKTAEAAPESLIEPVEETEDDWLAHLEEIRRENVPTETKAIFHEATDEVPDWLKSMSGVKTTPAEETDAEEPSSAAELPEWIAFDQAQEEPAEPEISQTQPETETPTELPEWLEGLAEEGASASDFSFEITPEGESVGEGEEPAETEPAQEQGLIEEMPLIPAAKEDYQPQESIPDWLKGLEDIPEAGAEAFLLEPEEALEETQAEPEEILPYTPAVKIPAEEYHPVEHLPDWLKALEDKGATAEEYHPVEHLPAWLKALEDKETLPEDRRKGLQAGDITPDDYHPIEQIPDWLKALETMEPPIGEEERIFVGAPATPQVEMESVARMEGVGTKEQIPAWLKDIEAEEKQPEREAGEEKIAQSLPEWSIEAPESAGEAVEEDLAGRKPKTYGPGREWQTDIEKLLETSDLAELSAIETQAIEESSRQKAKAERVSKPSDQIHEDEATQEPAKAIPEWLMDEEGISEAIEEVKPLAEESERGSSLPDWLAEVQRAAESFEAMVKDVLTGEKGPRAARKAESAAKEEARPPEEIPDWMREIMLESQPETKQAEEKESPETSGLPEWLKQIEEQAPSETGDEGQELIEADAVEEEPQFGNITAAIDWLENVTDQEGEPGEPIAPVGEETVPSFEIPEEAFEESQIELTSEEKQPGPVSSAWVLESQAAPQVLEQPTPADEIMLESEPAVPAQPGININKAGIADLEQLPRVGFRLAQNIVNYRQSHGEFRALDDLRNVPKLDAAILDEIASYVHFEDMPVYTENAEYRGEELKLAKDALVRGDVAVSMTAYNKQIALRVNLPEVIQDLLLASEQYPDELVIWQTLGDAYLQAGSLDEALDSYRKAEEILQ